MSTLVPMVLVVILVPVTGLVARRLSIPGSRLLISLLATALPAALGLPMTLPEWLRTPAIVLLGSYLGLRVRPESLCRLANLKLASSGAFIVGWYVFVTRSYIAIIGRILPSLTRTTAALSVLPGGIAEVSVLAGVFGGDLPTIMAFQVARYFAIIGSVPLLGVLAAKRVRSVNRDVAPKDAQPVSAARDSLNSPRYMVFVLVGTAGGVVFFLVGVPAGLLIGSLLAVSLANLIYGKVIAQAPPFLFEGAQVVLGVSIGSTFTPDAVGQVAPLAGAALGFAALVLATSLFAGRLVASILGWPTLPGFLAVVPGGLTPVMIIAHDLEYDVAAIGALQLIRLLSAIIVLPLFVLGLQ